MHELDAATNHVNEGEFSYRIPVPGYDRISDLSRSFNSMTDSLEGLIEESKQPQQLEAELEIAREVKTRLFPAGAPRIDGLEVLGGCRPARTVSGDFFDYMSLGDQRMAISFGDVSGKGISAALLMASLHSIMRAQCGQLRWGDARWPCRNRWSGSSSKRTNSCKPALSPTSSRLFSSVPSTQRAEPWST